MPGLGIVFGPDVGEVLTSLRFYLLTTDVDGSPGPASERGG